jgi:hypothetical protein
LAHLAERESGPTVLEPLWRRPQTARRGRAPGRRRSAGHPIGGRVSSAGFVKATGLALGPRRRCCADDTRPERGHLGAAIVGPRGACRGPMLLGGRARASVAGGAPRARASRGAPLRRSRRPTGGDRCRRRLRSLHADGGGAVAVRSLTAAGEDETSPHSCDRDDDGAGCARAAIAPAATSLRICGPSPRGDGRLAIDAHARTGAWARARSARTTARRAAMAAPGTVPGGGRRCPSWRRPPSARSARAEPMACALGSDGTVAAGGAPARRGARVAAWRERAQTIRRGACPRARPDAGRADVDES